MPMPNASRNQAQEVSIGTELCHPGGGSDACKVKLFLLFSPLQLNLDSFAPVLCGEFSAGLLDFHKDSSNRG